MLKNFKITKLANGKDLPLPKYKTSGSAGMDLCAATKKNIVIKKGEYKLVPTGLQIDLPKSYEAQIRPRSGLAIKNGLTVLNTPGTIDSDYRGEIGIILINFGKKSFTIKHGMRIAQMVISKVTRVKILETKIISKTSRGKGGFGSTGLK